MTDFEIVPSEYEAIPELLVRDVPGFAESPEFGEAVGFVDLPGIVVAAFARYLRRTGDKTAYAAIETLAASGDPAIENVLVTEFFANLGPRAAARLGPSARALSDRWD